MSNSHDATTQSRRRARTWTDAQIRAATPFPKPQGARDAEWEREAGRCFAKADITKPERALLRHIAEHADELVVARGITHDNFAVTWLVVPMPLYLLELLHAFEANLEDSDHNGDDDREPDADDELGDD